MAFVSVMRLQLRSMRYLPRFMWHVFTTTRQVRHAAGFLGGQLAIEGTKGFWTITAWPDEAAMMSYRNADAHQRAMPKRLQWCDEASVVHWQQEDTSLPDLITACQRMVIDGRLSQVRYPSALNAAKGLCQMPCAGLPLRAKRAKA